MGMRYQRGAVWWVKYYRNGRAMRESTGSTKESEAIRLLKIREGDIERGLPVNPKLNRIRFGRGGRFRDGGLLRRRQFRQVGDGARGSAQIAVVGSTVEERVSAPGETYLGTIVVRNLTLQDQPVRIYQTDYLFFADGTSHFDDPGSAKKSNAKWITPTCAKRCGSIATCRPSSSPTSAPP